MWLVNLNESLYIIHRFCYNTTAQTVYQMSGCIAEIGRGGAKNICFYPLTICKKVCIIMYVNIR